MMLYLFHDIHLLTWDQDFVQNGTRVAVSHTAATVIKTMSEIYGTADVHITNNSTWKVLIRNC